MPRQARILLVDDRAENLVALEATLSPLGQDLVSVSSGEQALQALDSGEFAVILLDIMMPGMDGFETATRIKQRVSDVPIIFLTAASAQPEQAFRGYTAGAVDYLAKPFDPWVLKAKVSVFVDLYVKNRQLREQAELIGGGPLTDQMAGLLGAIEDSVSRLSGLGPIAGNAEAEQTVTSLAKRVARLRDAFDAIQGTG